ncbi:Scr1 family TA system antitoxin-like transcriptional regulator [Spirillospora sp. NPDC047279]|uniref:Scr1 family TA system antitoxin-like transcriptional regulator n=1 Tax=Spirillospora sp. NPDC047279 TaxID=3155478 RepID=UPI0033D0808B
MHRTIVCVDVEGFGDRRRTNFDQCAVRAALYQALSDACAGSGVVWRECYREDRGDGVLVLVPPEVPKSFLVASFPDKLAKALAAHNRTSTPQTRIRLRMAVHAGEVHYDTYGVVGSAINLTFRLLEAAELKAVLAASSGAVALIGSEWFFEEVIQHNPAAQAERYRPVHVLVKETQARAWLRLVDGSSGGHAAPGKPGPTVARMVLGDRRREPERAGPAFPTGQTGAPTWTHDYEDLLSPRARLCLELEQSAALIRGYEVHAVPELLQTPDYAHAVLRFEHPHDSPAGITRRVDLLMSRQRTLYGPEPCRLWVIIDEAALHRRRGGTAAMREQLVHLVKAGELPHICIQIMPLSTGAAADGTLTLLRLPDPGLPDAVYLEKLTRGLHLDRPADVEHYQQVVHRLCILATQPAATNEILHRILQDL